MSKKASVYVETFGCQMNVADSERALTALRRAGFDVIDVPANADVLIYNTCSVRARAEQKVFNRLDSRPRLPMGRNQVIGILGCVAQLEGERLFQTAPPVQIVAGTRATDRLPELISRALEGEERLLDLGERRAEESWSVAASARSTPHTAFVPIIEGCNKFCTYCIVPYSRGRETSRPASEILEEIRKLYFEGFKEIHLLGQNVNSYRPSTISGLEFVAGKTPFAQLLRAVASTGFPRVKFTTSFPRDFHMDIVAALDENENLCNWIHLPVQSGSDKVLRAMRRGYKSSDYLKKVEYVRNAKRQYALTSDIIIGFPGETIEDFEETLKLVRRCKFDSLYIFKYSERAGTPASRMENDVSEVEKAARFEALLALQHEIQKEVFSHYLGRRVSVLVERTSTRSSEDLMGHSTCHKVVNFPGSSGLIGQVVTVEITAIKSHSLYGRIVTSASGDV